MRGSRHPHHSDRGRCKARLELLRQTDDPIQRHLAHLPHLRHDHERRKDEGRGISVRDALSVLRSLVRGTTDVVGTTHERLTTMMVPVAKFMPGAEAPPLKLRPIAHVYDGPVPESDDLGFASN